MGAVLGLVLGGWPGAALGFLIGLLRDVRMQHRAMTSRVLSYDDFFPDFMMTSKEKAVFAPCVIALGAKLSKIDGHVTREEVLAFRHVFRTPHALTSQIGELFDQARRSAEGYEPYAARLTALFGYRPSLLEDVLAGLFYIALADSTRLTRNELLYLRRVSVIFGFSETDFVRIARRVGITLTTTSPPPKKDSAYDVLGLPTTASDDVIKRTYRALVRKHHPDKLMAAGLSPTQVAEATEKIKKINAAYAEICRLRGIK
ncbi:MAG: TerB family tellurite resistance protein [Alphaproteobacteria bacterium]|nr:TerB family tellurite resistance protein [Alphaproteobacteria bacterium]